MKSALAGFITFAAAATASLLLFSASAAALTFNHNRVMDDQVFDNTSRMSANQIDTFLNQFPSSCISTNNHFQAVDPTGYASNTGFTYGANVSAGRVIYDAALAYSLNPQVILATLQKEQSLVTGGGGCSTLQYTGAMGYGCPDGGTTHNYSNVNLYTINGTNVTSVNGTCVNTAAKAGFSQQVVHAAWLLKFGEQRSEGNINWNVQADNSPVPGDHWDNSDDPQSCYAGPMTQGTWQVCPSGGSTYYDGYTTIDNTAIHIDSGATAALYWYTPHFSGNQNFVTIFTNWFGGTTVAGYAWTTTGYIITSPDGSVRYDPGRLLPGQMYRATLEAMNVGNQTWINSGPTPMTLGTGSGGNSIFCNNAWLACNRPAYLQEASVAPGQEGHFVFQFRAPYVPGQYRESFRPLAEFLTWFNKQDPTDELGIRVVSPGSYSWTTTGYIITSPDGSVRYDPGRLLPGQMYRATLEAQNVGTATWLNNGPIPVTLGSSSRSALCDSTWLACDRPTYLQEASVAPGQEGHFVFQFRAPYVPGQYRERFKPVAEFFSWFNDYQPQDTLGIWVVSPGTFTWSMNYYLVYDQTGTTQFDPGKLQTNQTYLATVAVTNTGTATWLNSGPLPVTLATSNPTSRLSIFCTIGWEACNRPALLTEASVAPGQTGHFRFLFKTPATPGIYRESFKPVAEFYAWFNDYDPIDVLGVVVN
jgi:hypothetical protein